ncbi:bifunctional [glutamate--ammonia ligase]-adenylyl-L-tyrosine phosphorylase/[glutamate--ammonia-ligase] adenylyltransferase [Myxococcota bacterium]|nr:bifunctional [glutamate--ammonia ligase]-adenylyl-L-tyrosine phosphorylase/[glutamate--ammonia-ligase] adenylyltransferase [Myxococcota bacterium]
MTPSPGDALARALQDLPEDPGLAGERLGPFAPAFPDPGAAARRVAALRLRVSPAALPGALRAVARAADPALALAGLGERLADPSAAVPSGEALDAAVALLGASRACREVMSRHPGAASEDPPVPAEAAARARAEAGGDDPRLLDALLDLKYRCLARWTADAVRGRLPIARECALLSDLADACVGAAVDHAYASLAARHGPPGDALPGRAPPPWGGGAPAPRDSSSLGFSALALGKLGSSELNYSSDVDLVYVAFDASGETRGGPRGPLPHRSFFGRVGEAVGRLLSQSSPRGFLYRVDLNLRPDGAAGPLVPTAAAAELHYLNYGQTWERSAWLRARVCAGDPGVGEGLLAALAPFVWRRYLDYGTLADMRGMKERIDRAARAAEGEFDVKLGSGGIRELEFFVQAHQLLAGGRLPALRLAGTLPALDALVRAGRIPEADAADLAAAWDLLRRLEHRIQTPDERHTQRLPRGERDLWVLARMMGLGEDPHPGEALLRGLESARTAVRRRFDALFAPPGGGAGAPLPRDPVAEEARALLDPYAAAGAVEERLRAAGFRDPDGARRRLDLLRDGPPDRRLRPEARRRFADVAPLLLERALASRDPDLVLERFDSLVRRIGVRGTLYDLLARHPEVLSLLGRLFGASDLLSDDLLRSPELLDALVLRDAETARRDGAEMAALLAARAGSEDEEGVLDAIRRFARTERLRIGLHLIGRTLDGEGAWGQLTAVAETCIAASLRLARAARARAGRDPRGRVAVLGLGRLGGGEMGFGSDLDLVFLYDPDDPEDPAASDPFARLFQRVLASLSAPTREGVAYEVDLRLRPSGHAGPVVTRLDAFAEHVALRAEPWERLALTRARAVAGEGDLPARAERAVDEGLRARPEDPGALAGEVWRLRAAQERELASGPPGALHPKYGRGGIAEVELAAQYLQLCRPEAGVREPSTPRALARLEEAGVLAPRDRDALAAGWRLFRDVQDRLRLMRGAGATAVPFPSPEADALARALLGAGDGAGGERLRARCEAAAEGVRGAFLRVLGEGATGA